MRVNPANAEQAGAWNGDEGAFWAANATRFDRAVAGYHPTLMDAAAITDGEKVLDIGCGTGQTTRDAARAAAPDGSALGVDLSAEMIELARILAAERAIDNATFQQADAQIHPFRPAAFDIAISRTGTMFFADPTAAFTNIARALRPGGRLVLMAWQGPEPNEWMRELSGAMAADRNLPTPPIGAPGPFAQADPDQVKAVLGSAGFGDITLTGLEEPMWFGADTDDARRFVLGLMSWMLQGLDDTRRHRAEHDLRAALAAHESADGVLFGSAAWLVCAMKR